MSRLSKALAKIVIFAYPSGAMKAVSLLILTLTLASPARAQTSVDVHRFLTVTDDVQDSSPTARRFQSARPQDTAAVGDHGAFFFDGATVRRDEPFVGATATGGRAAASFNGAPGEAVDLHVSPPPAASAPPATTEALSWSSVSDFFDFARGKRVARDIVRRAVGYAKKCYAHVKQALIDAGILDVADRTQTRAAGFRPEMAKMFAEDANSNPEVLEKLGYRRVDTKTMQGDDPSIIPDGTILNYAAGCAGFSKTAGHIELTVSREMIPHMPAPTRAKVNFRLEADQVLACSDGCSGRTLDFIRMYSEKGCLNIYVPVRPADAPPQD